MRWSFENLFLWLLFVVESVLCCFMVEYRLLCSRMICSEKPLPTGWYDAEKHVLKITRCWLDGFSSCFLENNSSFQQLHGSATQLTQRACAEPTFSKTSTTLVGADGFEVGSPPLKRSHEVRPFGKGSITPGLGDLLSPWLLTTYPRHQMILQAWNCWHPNLAISILRR